MEVTGQFNLIKVPKYDFFYASLTFFQIFSNFFKIFQSFSKNFKIFENFHIFLAHKKCVTPNFLVILVTHRDRLVKKVPCYKFCQSFGLLSTNIQRFSWFKGYPRGSMTVRIGSKSSYLGVGGYLADRWPVSKNFGIASTQLAYDPPSPTKL